MGNALFVRESAHNAVRGRRGEKGGFGKMNTQWDIIGAQYVTSAVRSAQYPAGEEAEVAFIGRSNVGKSTLINSLTRRHGLARVSGTPGKTQTINFYSIEMKEQESKAKEKIFFVDLPGYGFAKSAQHSKDEWSAFIGKYLEDSPRLRLVCQLIDIRHKPLENDIACYEWLRSIGRETLVVLTKADKVSKSAAYAQRDLFKKTLGLHEDNIMIYSASYPLMRLDLIGAIKDFLAEK